MLALCIAALALQPSTDFLLVAGHEPTGQAPPASVVQAEQRLYNAIRTNRLDEGTRAQLKAHADRRADELNATPKAPIRDRDPYRRVLAAYQAFSLTRDPVRTIAKHPTADTFPGAVPSDALRIEREVEIDLSAPGWHSTGLYAPAGELITFSSSRALPQGTRVRIGAHKDNIRRRAQWKRPLLITREDPFAGRRAESACAFGGAVYIVVPQGHSGTARVTVEGAVQAPHFRLGAHSNAEWKRVRNASAPWAELECDGVILSIESSKIRDLEDADGLMELWQETMDHCADLAGISRTRTRPERIVPDVEISAGFMHSGYPIMLYLPQSDELVSVEGLRDGTWGIWHELGHNQQSPRLWTFNGTVEVTCNLFSLYLNEKIAGRTDEGVWGGLRNIDQRLADQLKTDVSPWESGNLGLRLQMYRQMQAAFGWEPFKRVFADYAKLPRADWPKTDQAKRDMWLVRFSQHVGRDLGPFFDAWGLGVTAEAKAKVADLPDWMPENWPR